jgi:hypothetical protein
LVGRLLVIERREALSWGFDPAAGINAPSSYAPNLTSHADPNYGTFTTETDLLGESGPPASHTSVLGENGFTDTLLDREAGAHGALKIHTRGDPIPFLRVIRGLFMSSRAMAAVANSLVYGYVP